ncbi:hypothetical protein NPN18_25110, partial [Vibrio parahaemolyticus]|nr:hypothetical protein [Vibrio parahaemolyticus]
LGVLRWLESTAAVGVSAGSSQPLVGVGRWLESNDGCGSLWERLGLRLLLGRLLLFLSQLLLFLLGHVMPNSTAGRGT